MKNIKTLLVCTVLIAVLASCGNFNTNTMEGLGSALLQFPATLVESSAATSTFKIKTQPADITGYLDYLYRPVRNTYSPMAADVIEFVDNILESVELNIFGNQVVMAALDEAGSWASRSTDETEAYRITAVGLTYTVEIWKIVDGEWLKNLHLVVTKNGEAYSGTAIATADGSGLAERPVYQVDFDTADPAFGKYVEVKAVKIEPVTANDNIPRKLWLKAWQTGDDFYVAANVHYVQVDIENDSPYYNQFMSRLGGTEASYIYQGSVDTVSGYGGVSLALVPASETDTSAIFADYSIGEIYKQAIADWVRSDPDIGETTPVNLIVALNSYIADPALQIDTGSTTAQIFTGLQAVKDALDAAGDTSGDLDAVLFVVKVVNPGYYDETGFVGTDELNKPAWAADVPAFSGEVSVSAQAIADASFDVAMPAPAQPDF